MQPHQAHASTILLLTVAYGGRRCRRTRCARADASRRHGRLGGARPFTREQP